MPKLLYIDTTGEIALIGLSIQSQIVAQVKNEQTQNHAEFVQTSIQNICTTHSFDLAQLDAIVVTLGPGSYTGMRVGLASAKGIAYALDKPLIGLSSLALLARAGKKQINNTVGSYRIFSMIDARRMEVFGALYNQDEKALTEEKAIILDSTYLNSVLQDGPIYCLGSGAFKTVELVQNESWKILDTHYSVVEMQELAQIKWDKQDFENLAYVGPTYIKEVYTIPSKQAK